jgi:3-deoxy-manno-octulosonate cytidylyltransferase (CMP-KDO synthetase)
MTQSSSRVHIVVPARYASTRLPAKPLVDICGKPMIVRVVERLESLVVEGSATSLTVATDHADILYAVKRAGYQACMTHVDHPTGTDRLAQAASLLQFDAQDIVINVQGDEPLIDPAIVTAVAKKLLESPGASISTASHPIDDCETFFNPNVVKVVVDERGLARYFSRAPIPYARDAFAKSKENWPRELLARRHIGLYAYRVSYLQRYTQLPQPLVEKLESLEQLRALLNGFEIVVLDWPHALAAFLRYSNKKPTRLAWVFNGLHQD